MRIFICGDSISASYTPDKAPQAGWGQYLGEFLPRAEIRNHAMPGRSTKSFIDEGRLDDVEKELESGDLMLIQFAHNDWNPKPERFCEARGGYSENLRRFIATARARGAVPVLLTPICMRIWQDGELQPTHGDYPAAMRDVASETGAALIDMYAESFSLTRELGEEASKRLFLYTEAKADDAHTSFEGARAFAKIIAQRLKELNLIP